MIDESVEFRNNNRENISTTTSELRNTMETAENTTSGINAYGCEYNYQLNQQFTEVLSTNDNEFQLPAAHSDYYTTHAEPAQQRQSNLTDDHSVNEQPTQQTPRIEHSRVPIYSKDYQMLISQREPEETTSMEQRYSENQYSATITPVASNISPQHELTVTPIINSTSLPVNSIRDYGSTEICGPYSAALDNPQQMSSTNNRLPQASEYNNPDVEQQANMQTEAINSVLAHQWHHRREKLPIATDATFHAEWQINRAEVVNTAEIQKRKLQFFQRKAEEQAGRVNQKNSTSSTEKQTKQKQKPSRLSDSQLQQQQQQLLQAHQLYRLQQMQQQNHLRSLTPDSLSSSRQFTNSPASLHSSYSPAQQLPQFPYIQSALPQQIQLQQTLHPQQNNDPIYVATFLQQQQLALQMLQQQQLQQQLMNQPYPPAVVNPNFFDKWANLNQQKYQEALQENVARHKGTYSARQSSRKRKRQDLPRETLDDKENASVNSEPRLVIDEAAAQEPSSVPMDSSKCNDVLEPKSSFEGNVIVNLNDLSSSDGKIVESNELQSQNQSTLNNLQAGMWDNKYAMLQNWLATQQQAVDQGKSEIAQYGHAD